MPTEVTKLTIEIEQRDGETAFSKLLHEALKDIRADRANPAGTHVVGVGYYRIIEYEVD